MYSCINSAISIPGMNVFYSLKKLTMKKYTAELDVMVVRPILFGEHVINAQNVKTMICAVSVIPTASIINIEWSEDQV